MMNLNNSRSQTNSITTPNVTFSDFNRLGQPQSITQIGLGTEILNYSALTGALDKRHYDGSHTLLAGLGVQYGVPDSAGRPTGFDQIASSGTTVTRSIGYGYDPATGLLQSVTTDDQSHVYGYFPDSALIQTITSKEGTADVFKQTRAYDKQARLTSIRTARAGSSTAQISSYSYDFDELNRRTKATLQDGGTWSYDYNDRSEVTGATRRTTDGGPEIPQLAATYDYDGIGNRSSSTSPVLGDHVYTPNSLNQYDSITTGTSRTVIGRAPVGWSDIKINGNDANRTGELYHLPVTLAAGENTNQPVWKDVAVSSAIGAATLPTNHFWFAKATTSPAYDDDGNLTNDGRWIYTWNAENRLVQMESIPANATPAVPGYSYARLNFVYNWEGKRIAKTLTTGSPTGTAATTRYLLDGWNVIAELEGSTTRNYTWGTDLSGTLQGAGGVGGLLAVQITNSQTSNYLPSYDGNGNITAWTKSTETTPTSRREYDAFGNALVSEGIAPCDYGFSTKQQDAKSGFYYYGYRYYDPVTGRWPSRDPIGELGGENLYVFLAN